jgi:hypothetical protein
VLPTLEINRKMIVIEGSPFPSLSASAYLEVKQVF